MLCRIIFCVSQEVMISVDKKKVVQGDVWVDACVKKNMSDEVQ